ncbi:MAG: Uracil phosphoribosyltransferase, partial [uncultured Truepera sp.]
FGHCRARHLFARPDASDRRQRGGGPHHLKGTRRDPSAAPMHFRRSRRNQRGSQRTPGSRDHLGGAGRTSKRSWLHRAGARRRGRPHLRNTL